jgi:hypothetical protein
MSPSDRVAQLYPPALGSLFVTFYDLQGYGGGIRSRLHMGSNQVLILNDIFLSDYYRSYGTNNSKLALTEVRKG